MINESLIPEMTAQDNKALYNLKVVVHETGLKPDTLRVWEKRYGLPQPQRSEGGHRLYTWRDIETLKWLVARQEEGLSISRAVKLWRKLESDGQDPLQNEPPTASSGQTSPTIFKAAGEGITQLQTAWFSACVAFDEQQAEAILSQAFAQFSPEVVCVELLQKSLSAIGEEWYRGEVSVQQEHFASALALRRLQSLIASAPIPTRQGLIMIGCPPEEDHSFSPLLLTFFLRRRGLQVAYLGANVPLARMEETLQSIKPELVVMSAQQLHTASTLFQMANVLQQHNVPLAFGGHIFNLLPAAVSRIPGYFLGQNLNEAVGKIEKIMTAPSPLPTIQPAEASYQHALAQYQEQLPQIEAYLWQTINHLNIPKAQISIANQEMARNISAALILNDLDYMSVPMSWLKALLLNRDEPLEILQRYYHLYYTAAKTYLDDQAEPLLVWLKDLAGE